ncbi:MAG: membrane or secreted protein [Cyclobacteriaceae bacterium]
MRSALPIAVIITLISCGQEKSAKTENNEQEVVEAAVNLSGAWKNVSTDSSGLEVTAMAIVTDKYVSDTWYNLDEKKFVGTSGGSYQVEGNTISQTFEFNTLDSTQVGKTISSQFEIEGDKITFRPSNSVWTRVDDGSGGDLAGAWLITGRQRDGEISRRTPGARKTMKILSGTRFQWIAYNDSTAGFFGTGGGTYSTVNGKYTENIEFFSRNADRVGASLEFDYELDSGEWHHSGLSSKGDPIYEIWTPREMLD